MADNVSPQAILVDNQKLRPAADRVVQFYNLCKQLSTLAVAQGWVAQFPNTTDNVIDGAATDGRTIVTNQDCLNVITFATTFTTFLEANSNLHLNHMLKMAVNVNP